MSKTKKSEMSNVSGKRKLDEMEKEEPSEEVFTDEDVTSSSDEENLFIPQAREVLAQAKHKEPRQIPNHFATEDDIDSNTSDLDYIEEEINASDEAVHSSENRTSDNELEVSEDEIKNEDDVEPQGESIEELSIGREKREEDDVVVAISNAVKPKEKNKPSDIRNSSMVTDVCFHPNKELIAISNIEGEIACHKYGIEENELLHTLNHHKKSCRVLKFNEDGALLFSASKDKSVVITDTETMKVTQTLQKAHSSPIYSLLCINSNVWASGDDDGFVKIWDRRRSNQAPVVEFKEMEEFVSSMVTDSNTRLLICTSGEGTLTAFNTRAKKMVAQSEVYPSEMNCVALARQETKVLAGLGNGSMYIFDWDAFGYHSDGFGDHPSGVNCMLPIADNLLITGCDDGRIRAISVFPHKFVGVVGHHRFPIEHLDISTCGHYVASSSHDNRVRFWNISFFEDPEFHSTQPKIKKSVRNKNRSLRKQLLGFQLPSSKRRNKGDFFAGLAEPEPETENAAEEETENKADESDGEASSDDWESKSSSTSEGDDN